MERGAFILLMVGAAIAVYATNEAVAATDTSGGDNTGRGSWFPFPFVDNTQSDGAAYPDVLIDGQQPDTGITIMSGNFKVNDYPKYAALITAAEDASGIPTDLLARLLYQESRYNPDIISGKIKSPAGALGIAQFMPATAAEMNINPLNPIEAIPAAGRYLKQQYRMFGNWSDALGAYNWGAGNYKKYLQGQKTLPTETRNYISQITADVGVA